MSSQMCIVLMEEGGGRVAHFPLRPVSHRLIELVFCVVGYMFNLFTVLLGQCQPYLA